MVVFGLFVPAIAAISLSRLVRQHRDQFVQDQRAVRRRAAASIAFYGLGVAALVLAYWVPWWQFPPQISAEAATQVRTAATLLADRPAGTPLILVTEQREATVFMNQMNFLRATVPSARAKDVHTFVGTPSGFLEMEPLLSGSVEEDRVAVYLARETEPFLRRSPLVVILEAFDPIAYRAARGNSNWSEQSNGVLVLGSGPLPGDGEIRPIDGRPGLRDGGPPPMSAWLPVWAGAVTLAILIAVGLVWTKAILPRSDQLVQLGLAPAVGFAALGLAAIVVDASGSRLSEGGGVVAAMLALGLGATAVVIQRWRHHQRAVAEEI